MRILHVIHRFLPEAVAGGTTTYLVQLCREQQKTHQVGVFASGSPQTSGDEHELVECEGIPIWKVHPARQHWHWSHDNPFVEGRFRALVASFRPHAIHFHSLALLSNALPEAARELGVPTLFTLHDCWFVCLRIFPWLSRGKKIVACKRPGALRCTACLRESMAGPSGQNPLTRPLREARLFWHAALARPRRMQRVFSSIQRFAAPSRWIKGYYAQHGFQGDRIVFSPYGIDLKRHQRINRQEGGPLRIGYLGGAHPSKGLRTLLSAFRAFEGSAMLCIYGVYPEKMTSQFASPSIEFSGTVEGLEKLEALRSLDVIVVPSLHPDNSPLVIHEARALGIPVIGSAIGGIPEMIDDGKTGFLVPAGDARALEERIRPLVETPALARSMAKDITPYRSIQDNAGEMDEHYTLLRERARRT